MDVSIEAVDFTANPLKVETLSVASEFIHNKGCGTREVGMVCSSGKLLGNWVSFA